MKGFIKLHGYDNHNKIMININTISTMWEEFIGGRNYNYIRTIDTKTFLVSESIDDIQRLIETKGEL